MMEQNNTFTSMQKGAYHHGTSNHEEHNDNPDYWNILLGDLKDKDKWDSKNALDFACGKGRNVINMMSLCDWNTVDGVDISEGNIEYCKQWYNKFDSKFYCNNGVDVSELNSDYYDFVMSTIALQHIPVYEIRRSLMVDILRTMKSGGLFSFQMGFGSDLSDVLNRPRSKYYDNSYDATGTNSEHDVRVLSESEVVEDLTNIGFVNISTEVKSTFSDIGHPQWIYVKAYKP